MELEYETLNDEVKHAESVDAGLIEKTLEEENEDWFSHFSDGLEFEHRGKRRDYIIPGWLPSHGLTALNAKRGTGKSTILLDLALCLASDSDWHGTPTKHGYNIVYFCGEDDEGVELNLSCWYRKYGKTNPGRIRS